MISGFMIKTNVLVRILFPPDAEFRRRYERKEFFSKRGQYTFSVSDHEVVKVYVFSCVVLLLSHSPIFELREFTRFNV